MRWLNRVCKARLLSLVFCLLMVRLPSVQGGTELSDRGAENVSAFIRLMGNLQYFYAGDAASQQDWDAFLANHVESLETAPDDDALRDRLLTLLTPLVPELVIQRQDEEEISAFNTPPVDSDQFTVWVRWGLGVGRSGQLIPGRRITYPLGSTTVVYEDPVYLRDHELPVVISIPDPAQPYVLPLTDELIAYFPLAVYSNAQGTLPVISAPLNSPTPPLIPSDRALRLAVVGQTWNLFQHLYPYRDSMAVDWDTVLLETLRQAAADDAESFGSTLQEMTALLGDAHTVTSGPALTSAEPYALPFTWDIIEGALVVTTLLDTSSPLLPGDRILAIDGEPVEQVLQRELRRAPGVGQFKRYTALRYLLTGVRNSTVSLTLEGVEEPVTVRRTLLTDSSAQFQQREYRPEMALSRLDHNLWYVDLTRVSSGELRRTVSRLAYARGVILDLRGYPANDAPTTMLTYLTEQPLSIPPSAIPLYTFPNQEHVTLIDVTTTVVEPAALHLDIPVVWLINANGTYSYPETILAIVEGYDLGTLVGEPTAGASGNRVWLPLMGGFSISWTGLYVTKVDGTPLFRVGVTPEVPVERSLEGVRQQNDELLLQAVQVIEAQLIGE